MKQCVPTMLLWWLAASLAGAAVGAADDADKTAIEAAIASYVDAFNKGDAQGLAGHWSERGEYVTPGGKTLRGQQELEADFATYFGETRGAKLELIDTRIEFLSPSVAVETGTARVQGPDQAPSETQYKAIHVKTAAGWKIDSVRETDRPTAPPSHYEQLQPLEWMIGQWVDADQSGTIETSCRWTTNRNFIMRSFRVNVEGQVDFEGTQIIGWDPAAETIRSWMFDSDGGFAVGRWAGDGSRWTVQTLNVLPDGRTASATNIYEVVDEKTVRFSSIGRQVGGELLPNIEPVEVIRITDD